MNSQSRTFRVLIDADMRYLASREIIGGIHRYAALHANWEIYIGGNMPESARISFDSPWKPDGVITGEGELDHLSRKIKIRNNLPVVFLYDSFHKTVRKNFAWAIVDQQAIGRAAADFLMNKSPATFAFVHSLDNEDWSVERGQAFATRLKEAGIQAKTFRSPAAKRTSWGDERKALAQWLMALPKPVAVFAACDQRAQHVLNICRAHGISVPDQVLVLGVDNNMFICEFTIPSLSSIQLEFNEGGFLAAQRLDEMMHGKTPRQKVIRYGIHGIVERNSTADTSGARHIVALAIDFIRRNALTTSLSVDIVAAAVHCSRRHLEKCFKSAFSKPVFAAIQDARLEHVTRLLTRSAMPIDAIAPLAGFSSGIYLKALFKRKFGMTMSMYRTTQKADGRRGEGA